MENSCTICSFCGERALVEFCETCNRNYCKECQSLHKLSHDLKKAPVFSNSKKSTSLALFNYYTLLYALLIGFGMLALVALFEGLWLLLDSKNYAEGVDSATDGFMAFVAGLIIGWITYSFFKKWFQTVTEQFEEEGWNTTLLGPNGYLDNPIWLFMAVIADILFLTLTWVSLNSFIRTFF